MNMRVLTDEEAHVLLLDHVDLIHEEHLVAEQLAARGYLVTELGVENGREYTDYLITPTGELALQCYLALQMSKQVLR